MIAPIALERLLGTDCSLGRLTNRAYDKDSRAASGQPQ